MSGHGDEAVFHNGFIFDGVGFLPPGTTVRVADGRIASVDVAERLNGAEPIDLRGGTLLPGFIDAHAHPVFAGNQLRHCDLRDAASADGYVATVAAYADSHPDEEWITGGGWAMEAFPGGIPSKELLDAVVPDRPVFLPNRDGHGAWVNSRALDLAGIDDTTPDPPDGRIDRDAGGVAVGMLQEGAASLVGRLLPVITADDWYTALLTAQDYLLALGVTGWQDAIIGDYQDGVDPLPAYLRADKNGALQASVVGALWWDRHKDLGQLESLLHRRAQAAGQRFVATSVKMMLDGVAENHTAAMLEPYLDTEGCASEVDGLDFIDPQRLPEFVSALDREGFQVHFHALGDRAVRNALDAVEAARTANPDGAQRHHLAHLQVVHPDDVTRFAPLRATANIQSLWAQHDSQMDDLTIPYLGDRRTGWQYPFRSLQAAGAAMCAGSDWPVTSPNPFLAIHVAVNRSLPAVAGGSGSEPFLPEQAVSLASALSGYTSGSAKVNGVDDHAGAIRPGYDADLAVVDADLSHVAPSDIHAARVGQTWIRGRLVFESR
ncbi:MAG TPA: amidohydrolase [Jatrophihabitans sp.]